MKNTARVQCPWCFEWVEIWIDPDTQGRMVRDCEICCRPWDLSIRRDSGGDVQVVLHRSN